MSMWSTLEIEPTVDISVIKKAYAKKLRIHHPEDDPEGYQTLREAYDRALKFARNNEFSEIDNEVLISDELRNSDIIKLIHLFEEEDFGDNNEENECIQQESEWVEGADNLLAGNEQLVEEFFQKAETLYNSFFDRIEKRNWEELLNSEIIWKLDLKEFMNKRMLEFLTGHHYLPQEVWYLLNEIFHWEYQEHYLKYNCTRFFAKYLLKQISHDIAPRYCYFKRNMEIDIEEYLNYRETAFAALCNNDLKGAKNNIRMAFKIYPNDPDLLCMNGEYNIRMSDRKSAFKYFKAAILVNPDDNNIYLYQAQIMFNFFEYNGAIRACRILLKKNNNELEVRTLLGKCYFHSKKWHRASRIFLENYRKAPNDFETRRYLSRLADRLRRVLPVRFIAKRDLKKIYRVLGEYNNLKKVKIAPRQIILLLLWIILACICFKVWISGKSYSIIVLFLAQIIYYFVKKKLKR